MVNEGCARRGDAAAARAGDCTLIRCLRCGPEGRLTRVAAVVSSEREVIRVGGDVFGPGGLAPVRARAVRVSSLARFMAPPRRPRSVAAPVLAICVIWLVLATAAGALATTGGVSRIAATAVAVSVFGGVIAVSWLRRGSSVAERDTRQARWLWERSWYCDRCGFVSLLAPAVTPQTFEPVTLATALFEIAGRIQWRPTSSRADESGQAT